MFWLDESDKSPLNIMQHCELFSHAKEQEPGNKPSVHVTCVAPPQGTNTMVNLLLQALTPPREPTYSTSGTSALRSKGQSMVSKKTLLYKF